MQVSLSSFFTEVLPLLAQKAPDLIGSGKTPPAIALMGLGGTVLNVLGTILLGSSVIRSKVFPRLTGIWPNGVILTGGYYVPYNC